MDNPNFMRIVAVLVLFAFAAFLVSTAMFIVFNSAHNCLAAGCPVCKILRGAVSTLNFSLVVSFSVLALISVFVLDALTQSNHPHTFNPIKMKVRLLN